MAPIDLLVLAPDDLLLDFYERTADRFDAPFDVRTTSDPTDALASISADGVYCLVTCQSLSVTTGIEFAEEVRAVDETLPIVVHTWNTDALRDEATAVGVDAVIERKLRPTGHSELFGRVVDLVADRQPSPA